MQFRKTTWDGNDKVSCQVEDCKYSQIAFNWYYSHDPGGGSSWWYVDVVS
jgi:hypothetical protein